MAKLVGLLESILLINSVLDFSWLATLGKTQRAMASHMAPAVRKQREVTLELAVESAVHAE